ncbi:MAG: cell envelope biogenesis protein OmpA [Rhodospirillales bacterium CG15_BIG_FIL_POST_REV_8_21_14_020_66_15]|nr:MAG: cell envelope biogenesis protein OmpA [Rhodospirillales bacterium CG15_BIG_FIL_POST_REV_8_21_14_020_66_15]
MQKFRTFSAAGAIMLAAFAVSETAWAQSPGPYVSGALGVTQPRDWDLKGGGVDTTQESDPGFAAGLAVGSTFSDYLRGEAELSFSNSNVDSFSGTNGSGETNMFGLMFNGYVDIPTKSRWTPYIGAGIGGAVVDFSDLSPVGGSRISDSDHVFAYQGIAGVTYKIDDRMGLFTEYRYVGTADRDLRTDSGVNVEGDSGEHRIMVGLRWSFGAPKPAPKAEPMPVPVQAPAPAPAPKPEAKPAPAPEAPRNYLVFFDWDKSNLTADARAIIKAAATNRGTMSVTRIQATGHADRSGPDAYNMGLSKRRAESVKAELIKLGVPAGEIVILWKGERDPLVQTPDGVREPQNRRVEIILNK